jgi:NAD(P)-dependent dehydrogenase (short-subunit alcohol dehydrogenase family)
VDIRGKVAVITGAGSGIGQAVVLELARRGIKGLVLADLGPGVEQLASAVNDKAGGNKLAYAFIGDATDAAFRRTVYDEAEKRFGQAPAICVPCAGITRDALSVRLDKATGKASIYAEEDFNAVLKVNLVAPAYWAMEMVARIAQERHRTGQGPWKPAEPLQGAVIFIGSISSQGNKGQISYAATKRGLEGVASTLMKEAMFWGVRCGVIHPGFTDTPMVRKLGEEYVQKNVIPYTQLKRLIRPEEIADAIVFLISNSAVSGELWADAGWHPTA